MSELEFYRAFLPGITIFAFILGRRQGMAIMKEYYMFKKDKK